MNYNLAPEAISLILLIILLFSFLRNNEGKSIKFKVLRFMYIGAIAAVSFTLASSIFTLEILKESTLIFGEVTTVMYFILCPVVSYVTFLYAVAIVASSRTLSKTKWYFVVASLPYMIYIVLIMGMYFIGDLFTLSVSDGYVQGAYWQFPYAIAGFYAAGVLFLTITNIRTAYRSTMQILLLNLFLVFSITFVQFQNPEIILSGTASVMGILVIHLYIQNVSKSTDPLTDLPNRSAFMKKLGHLSKKDSPFSIYILSLRNFKVINEQFGLDFGDKVLQRIGSHVSKPFPSGYVFRYTGDEFAIIIRNNNISTQHYNSIFKKVLSSYDDTFKVESETISMDVICARVDYPDFGTNIKELVSAADYSIRLLKEDGEKKKFLYDISVLNNIRGNNFMIQQIKAAINDNSFELHYQPIYSTETKKFSHAEALVRMVGQNGSLIYPNDFIEIAEETGLIKDMTYIILEKVCSDLRSLMDEYPNYLYLESVSVNFSYQQFSQADMADRVVETLEKYNIPPEMIKIEITERTLIADSEVANDVIADLQEHGTAFELDDFGVDYSNMSVLLGLPVKVIKIDRSLLLAATSTSENKDFFVNLVNGIKATNREIVIEGVETEEQQDFLMSCGCEYLQGYVFTKPLQFGNFKSFLVSNNLEKPNLKIVQ